MSSTCASPRISRGSSRMPPISTFSSTTPAIFRAGSLDGEDRRGDLAARLGTPGIRLAINLTRAIYAQMKARGHGVIVSDIGAGRRKMGRQLYLRQRRQCGVDGVHPRARRQEPCRQPGRVVRINPGPVGTDRHVTCCSRPARKASLATRTVTRNSRRACPARPPRPCAQEIGDLMAFLASDRAGYTSGVIYTGDGGLAAGWA